MNYLLKYIDSILKVKQKKESNYTINPKVF